MPIPTWFPLFGADQKKTHFTSKKPAPVGGDARCQCQDAKMTKGGAGQTLEAEIIYLLE